MQGSRLLRWPGVVICIHQPYRGICFPEYRADGMSGWNDPSVSEHDQTPLHLQSPGHGWVEGGEDPAVVHSGVIEPCFHVCLCRSEDSFKQYFSEMPWLAVPYTDEARRSRLNRLYGIQGRHSHATALPGPAHPAHHVFGFAFRGKRPFYFHECSPPLPASK